MNFREATDFLCSRVEHEELARELGVSVAAIRQARLREEANAHRSAPRDWQAAVVRLAEQRAAVLRGLVERLKTEA